MMKRNNKKRGFTIIELTIVIAVIAILSAVLIPTFAGIIKKARLSSDEQAVRSMNTALVAADEDVDTLDEVVAYLAEEGFAAGTYAPLSKDHSLVYSPSLNKVLLYSASKNAIVYPAEYADCDDFVTLVTDDGETSNVVADKEAAANVATTGGVVAIDTEIALEGALYVQKDLTVNLSNIVSNPDDTNSDGVFCVKKGTLTINGNGTVNGKTAGDYNMAVWADGGEVVINGGTYTNEGAKEFEDDGETANNNELIYVKNGGKVIINGGTFICANPVFTLNSHDTQVGEIIVKGGKFYKYNPETDANDATIVVAEGYKVVQNGDWYEVVAE